MHLYLWHNKKKSAFDFSPNFLPALEHLGTEGSIQYALTLLMLMGYRYESLSGFLEKP